MFQALILLGCAVLIGIDQLTKYLAVQGLSGTAGIPVIPGVFDLTYVENKGAAFGILQDSRWLFIAVTAIVVGLLLFFVLRGRFRTYGWINAAAVMIAAGGIGNLIDRVSNGYVVDFLYFRLIDFPVFNFADCCVVIGAVLLLIQLLFFYQPDKKEEAHADGTEDTGADTGADRSAD